MPGEQASEGQQEKLPEEKKSLSTTDVIPVGTKITVERKQLGTADLELDGTLVLNLRMESNSALGHLRMELHQNDPDYNKWLKHIGPIKSGDTEPIYAFSEAEIKEWEKDTNGQ